ncbi:thioredoxin family protein [Candidatus Woesearchaeota archaeon]|nr:thioredoxin family protein [Candidatus Woesearchaeota archaeon]
MNILFGILALLLVVGCTTSQEAMENSVDNSLTLIDNAMENKAVPGDSMMESPFKGNVLAGKKSPYIEFNQEDYQKALDESKVILLYFYASWCPICKVEQQETFAAFNELDNENVVGFRVNYRDSDTDADEEELAKQFGITYQHTKVILKDGKQALKAPDSWDKQRYLDEITKVA